MKQGFAYNYFVWYLHSRTEAQQSCHTFVDNAALDTSHDSENDDYDHFSRFEYMAIDATCNTQLDAGIDILTFRRELRWNMKSEDVGSS